MAKNKSALYVSYEDPSAAVLFDSEWVRKKAAAAGLVITGAIAPEHRGYQWTLVMRHQRAGSPEVELPEDDAPSAEIRLPDVPPNASRIGLSG